MERYNIVFVTFLLFFTVHVNAQYMPGNVVVHSDPRLALLLKKNPTAAPPVTPVSYPDESSRKSHVTSKDITKTAKKNPLPPAPTHDIPALAPTHEIAANIPKKPNVTHPNGVPTAPPIHPFVTPAVHKDGRVVYTGKGFRVQIYYGNDREKAIKVKTEFMRQYPGVRTYLSYLSPSFRVKVGDYRNRSDAVGMLKEANAMYNSPCMIVPDEITIHTN